MQKSIKNILKSYQEDINEIGNLDLDDFKNVEKGLQSSRYFLQKLRIVVRTGEFKNKEEEIKFFKKQKPFIYGNLKFFVKLYKHLLLNFSGQ